jgi:hypothetical protein
MGADQDGRREIPTLVPEDVEGRSYLDQVKDDFGGAEWLETDSLFLPSVQITG